jgi:diguanylate cyclase (GGDEF)-like protein
MMRGADGGQPGGGPVRLWLAEGSIHAELGGAVHPDDDQQLRQLLATTGHAQRRQPTLIRWITGAGEERALELVVRADGGEVGIEGWDVTAHVQQKQALEHLALHDPLTGLANRVLFAERVHEELRRRARTGRDVALLYADLDGFKQVNDTWGHAAGDMLLTTVAERMRSCLRPGDVLARLGGDEFAACCPDLASPNDAMAIAHRLVDEVTVPVPLGTTVVRLSVAVGVAIAVDDDAVDGSRLTARADLAMYAAKYAGRQRVALAPSPERIRDVG